ncbi:hypothetical protein K474DRAFT_1685465 [Panus rudis PR-1116 ss-1]|nr:hypothetical protein K474DRAFT_1685465 [Panus rudis PR-1116 ss-1]
MAKRSLSPASLPEAKRTHTNLDGPLTSTIRRTFDNALYDELILVIFSYLSWTDLCAIQATNRNWCRLSQDNQLWKALYLNEYGRTRLRGGRGFYGRTDGREVRPLPSRARHEEDTRDWKWMFRISSNWRTGRCSIEQLSDVSTIPPPRNVLPPPPILAEVRVPGTHVLLAGDMIISASARPSHAPEIALTMPNKSSKTLSCTSTRHRGPAGFTALAIDQSPPSSPHLVRLVGFLSTGEFTVFLLNHQSVSSSSRLMTYVPTTEGAPRTSPIIQAVYHHPLLVTLSKSFQLSLYDLSSDTITHTQTLSSFTSFPPSSLVLSSRGQSTYKLVLAYAIPVFPSHWSVGSTELIISASSTSPTLGVTSSRTTRPFDLPSGWLDEEKMKAVREQWGRKVAHVADTQTDGKWVVLAPGEASLLQTSSADSSMATPYTSSSLHSPSFLQLYRLHLPQSQSPTSMPRMTFVRNLRGQTGPVSALALADGRCVSLGVNGSIWVWDLEAGTGAEVSSGYTADEIEFMQSSHLSWEKGSIMFDDRRIVTADSRGVQIRRFDV